MPVSTKTVGVLFASNIMTPCANHHRQMHYGALEVTILDDVFEVSIRLCSCQRLSLPARQTGNQDRFRTFNSPLAIEAIAGSKPSSFFENKKSETAVSNFIPGAK
jgi:hypothetical protein